MARAFDPSLYLVTDERLAGPRGVLATVEAAVDGGVTIVQLRDPHAATRDLVDRTRALAALLRPRGIPLVVNDRVDVALAAGAAGVHVGQSDMTPGDARRLIGPNAILGLSITSLDDLEHSDLRGVDYLGVGPIYAQATKPDAAPPIGLDGLAAIRALTALPIVAIGGISVNNAADILASGADGLAVVSAIMAASDPKAAASGIARLVSRAEGR